MTESKPPWEWPWERQVEHVEELIGCEHYERFAAAIKAEAVAQERERIARALDVPVFTVGRWVAGEDSPHPMIVRQMVDDAEARIRADERRKTQEEAV